MFDDWKKLHKLRKQSEIVRQQWIDADKRQDPAGEDCEFALNKLHREISYILTTRLEREASCRAIEIPGNLYWTHHEDGEDPFYDGHYLTEFGQASVRKLLREDK